MAELPLSNDDGTLYIPCVRITSFYPCDTGQSESWGILDVHCASNLPFASPAPLSTHLYSPHCLAGWPIWTTSVAPVQPDFQLCSASGDPRQEIRGRKLRSECLFFPYEGAINWLCWLTLTTLFQGRYCEWLSFLLASSSSTHFLGLRSMTALLLLLALWFLYFHCPVACGPPTHL